MNSMPLSENVTIFPCVSRTIADNEIAIKAKLTSEENITNIIKSITDKESYIISYDNGIFKLVLNGYYINLTEEVKDTKYVSLNMNPAENEHKIILGDVVTDDKKKFSGISISDKKPTDEVYLCLCEDGVIPDESYRKFDYRSSGISHDFNSWE